MNLQNYYREIRERKQELSGLHPDGCCLVISLERKDRAITGGTISEVSLDNAAKILTEGTHRLVTEAEQEAYRVQQAAERERAQMAATTAQRLRFGKLLGGGR
jgi:hypothetical protein